MPNPFLHKEDALLFRKVLRESQKRKIDVFLVGGYIRDLFLKRKKANPDIDFCLKNGSINFASGLAKDMKAALVILDKEHGICRIVKKLAKRVYTLDFSDFRAGSIEEDLLQRDLTINSIALNLKDLFSSGSLADMLIDPSGGLGDLRKKKIRVLDPASLDDDPLRILRVFSFACILGFNIEKDTISMVRLKKAKLNFSSPERIRDELFKILESNNTFAFFTELDKLRILSKVFPEIELMRGVSQGPYHHLDVLKHSFETLRQFEALAGKITSRQVKEYLFQNFSSQRSRYALLKLASFLHDLGKPEAKRRKGNRIKFYGHERIGRDMAEAIARRIRLSNEETDILKRIIFWHLRPGYLADQQVVTARAIFRYFRDTQNEAASVLLLSMADQRSTRGRLTSEESRRRHEEVCRKLLREFFNRQKQEKPVRILNGDDLISVFKLEPSPLFADILSHIEELQAIGKIKTRQQAIDEVKKFLRR
ncbi:MAG: HD domain-containing protein [Candidatus Omnitrophota bacterium]|jgi:poly(A) polymerase|nr:MAG: HD domain-containing protein [Candidatus Omnitrophota bacterium]